MATPGQRAEKRPRLAFVGSTLKLSEIMVSIPNIRIRLQAVVAQTEAYKRRDAAVPE